MARVHVPIYIEYDECKKIKALYGPSRLLILYWFIIHILKSKSYFP
jgi:hypothetical protein